MLHATNQLGSFAFAIVIEYIKKKRKQIMSKIMSFTVEKSVVSKTQIDTRIAQKQIHFFCIIYCLLYFNLFQDYTLHFSLFDIFFVQINKRTAYNNIWTTTQKFGESEHWDKLNIAGAFVVSFTELFQR